MAETLTILFPIRFSVLMSMVSIFPFLWNATMTRLSKHIEKPFKTRDRKLPGERLLARKCDPVAVVHFARCSVDD